MMMRKAQAVNEKQKGFIYLLSEQLNRMKDQKIHERDVAQRAGIDASTLSFIKQGERIKNPTWELRLRLAIALTENVTQAAELARQFFDATPQQTPDLDWDERLKEWKAACYQSVIKDVRLGLPLFFDTAPFLIAEQRGYFEKLGLRVKLDYVKWHKVLSYLDYGSPTDDREIWLSVYNRDSIENEGRKDVFAFCFPLSIYEPMNFAFWAREEELPSKKSTRPNHQTSPEDEVVRFLEKTHYEPKIIISGSDMQRGVEQMFLRSINRPVQDACFIVLDQYCALEAFLDGLGDGFVGGVPQRMRAESRENLRVLVRGDQIGLGKQYNGIVCRKQDVSHDYSRRAIVQILWCWYKALLEIEGSLEKSARLITNAMNVHASTMKYEPEDFISFWQRASFDLPRVPNAVAKKIENDGSYTLKFYDQTLNFMELMSEMEALLPMNGKISQ